MNPISKTLRRVGIAGTGSCVPDRVLTNEDLSKMVETSDEWIQQRTGIKERRLVSEGETTATMSAQAARRALEAARIKPEEIDLIVMGTVSGDYIFPATACLVAKDIGAVKAAGFDVSAACTGFLVALSTGAQFVSSGMYNKVLVIGAETLSKIVDYEDRSSCILFGDGAGAAVLTPLEEAKQGEILHSTMGMDGTQFDMIWIPVGGTKQPNTPQTVADKLNCMQLRGREVYKFAVQKMVELVEKEMARYPGEEIGLLIPHQVNLRIIESAMEKLNLPPEKVWINIQKYGNTSAAAIPIALDEAVRAGKMPKDKLSVFVAFGAGLTWGSVILRW